VFIEPDLGVDLFPGGLETVKGQMMPSPCDVFDELPTATLSFKAVNGDRDAPESRKAIPQVNESKNQNGRGATTFSAVAGPSSTGRPVRLSRLKRKKIDPDFVETGTDDEAAEKRASDNHNK
jgi:hypothetical protein